MFALLSPRIWIALALAVFLAFTHGTAYRSGKANVRAAWDADKAKRTREALAESEKNRGIEQERQHLQAKAEQRKNDEFNAINARLGDALVQLRDRPERPAADRPAASNPTDSQACTGAGLYRPDADFLVREAAAAARVLAERDALWQKYDALTVKP